MLTTFVHEYPQAPCSDGSSNKFWRRVIILAVYQAHHMTRSLSHDTKPVTWYGACHLTGCMCFRIVVHQNILSRKRRRRRKRRRADSTNELISVVLINNITPAVLLCNTNLIFVLRYARTFNSLSFIIQQKEPSAYREGCRYGHAPCTLSVALWIFFSSIWSFKHENPELIFSSLLFCTTVLEAKTAARSGEDGCPLWRRQLPGLAGTHS